TTKMYFPRLAVPFASVGAALVDFGIAFGLLLGLILAFDLPLTASLLSVPLVMAPVVMAATGVGTLLAALNVAYRDFRYVIPFLIQVWMFATPTVYMQVAAASSPSSPAGGTSSALKFLLTLNPITALIAAFRAATLGGPIPWTQTAISFAVVAALFVFGCLYFRRVEDSFADII